MSEMSFMPWYCIVEPVTIGKYTFLPYFRDKANPELSSRSLEQEVRIILKSYLDRPYTSIDAAGGRLELSTKIATVIIHSEGKSILKEMDILQYVVSFCGISGREFVNSGQYLCSDNLKIIVQKYPDPISDPFDPSLTTKLKHGSTSTGFSPGLFREVRSWYVANQNISGNRLKFDIDLANALWKFCKGSGKKKSIWENQLFPSLFSFHFANTDSLSSQIECTYSQAAIERLFLGQGHSENTLVEKIKDFFLNEGLVFESFASTARNWQSITYMSTGTVQSSDTIFEAWIRELTRLRNRFAHGNYKHDGTWVWSLQEHLVLSSFVFPLLVKLFISEFDSSIVYSIDKLSLNKLKMFEKLLAQENYFVETLAGSGETPWSTTIADSRWL